MGRARDNVHMSICFSPAGENLRVRCRNFPGVVNCSTIDWFFPWPENALEAVSKNFMEEEDLPVEHKAQIMDHVVQTHLSIRKYSDEFLSM